MSNAELPQCMIPLNPYVMGSLVIIFDFPTYIFCSKYCVSISIKIKGFTKSSMYQGSMKCTVAGVFEDLKFNISEGWLTAKSKIEVFLPLPCWLSQFS